MKIVGYPIQDQDAEQLTRPEEPCTGLVRDGWNPESARTSKFGWQTEDEHFKVF